MSDPEFDAIVAGVTRAVRELLRSELDGHAVRLAALEARPGPRDGRDGLPGPPGRDGAPGADGAAGADGLGLDGFEAEYDGARTLTHRYRSGERVKEFRFVLPIPAYQKVWSAATAYERGDLVTWDGSIWHANTATTGTKPGDGGPAWTLAVKRAGLR